MLRSFLLYIFFLISITAISQSQKFTLISIPQKYNYDKQKFNQEIRAFESKQEVRIFLKEKKIESGKLVFTYINPKNEFVYWTINTIEKGLETESDYIYIQSKYYRLTKIFSLNDFAFAFPDSIVIFDSLKTALYLQDSVYKRELYRLRVFDGKSTEEQSFPFEKDSLIFIPDVLRKSSKFYSYEIFNSKNPSRIIHKFNAYTLNFEDINILKDIKEFAFLKNPNITVDNIKLLIYNYLRINYGDIDMKQLEKWLNE